MNLWNQKLKLSQKFDDHCLPGVETMKQFPPQELNGIILYKLFSALKNHVRVTRQGNSLFPRSHVSHNKLR